MKYILDIPDYTPNDGLVCSWEDGFEIKVRNDGDQIVLIANKAGLISLAKQLLTLSMDQVSAGNHYHLDDYNSLEEGSLELVIVKK